MKRLVEWSAQVITLALAIISLRIVMVERSRSIDTPMPKAEAKLVEQHTSRKAKVVSATGDFDASGVAYRLIDHIDEAELRVPDFDEPRTAALLKNYWRRMRSPFVAPHGSRGYLIQQVGIAATKAPAKEEEHALDDLGRADPRLWGLDEGSYDQREAILAPPPSRMTWNLTLQERSRFQTSIATFAGDREVRFEVALVSRGNRQILQRRTIARSSRWEELLVDLSAFRGEVSLELSTSGTGGSLAAWGSPIITSPGASSLPYNVVFFVVDAMRPDALASTHDTEQDARMAAARISPHDAWLPRMPEVAPNLDRLAAEGATFASAWSAAMWTRPATLAMLSGMRASRLGLPILELEPRPAQVRAFYEMKPPLWPLLMRAQGAVTRAVINNMYLCGYVGVGVDTGFESITDHRYRIRDTEKITSDTIDWLELHRNDRFALFVNYVSPHAPYDPETADLELLDRASPRPGNRHVRKYLAEIRKDDAAIGLVLQELAKLGLASKTIVIVTADHGETLSEAHDWVAVDVAKGVRSGRFTHLSTMWEEAARVPIIFALPGVIPAKRRITDRVQTTDILPTLLDLLRVEGPPNLDGVSLKPLLFGAAGAEHPVVIEGRGASAIIDGKWHFIQRLPVARRLKLQDVEFEKSVELYDLIDDPGERRDVSANHRDVVERLQHELESRLAAKPSRGGRAGLSRASIHMRISSGPASGDLVGDVVVAGTKLSVASSDSAASVQTIAPNSIRIQSNLQPGKVLDFDLVIEPATAAIDWTWRLAGHAWPKTGYHVGALGLVRDLSKGIPANDSEMVAPRAPYVASSLEQGIFVTRDTAGEAEATVSEAAQREAQQAMQAWGYVRRNEPAQK